MGTKIVTMWRIHCKRQYTYRVTLASGSMGCSISEKSRNEAAEKFPDPNCPSKRTSVLDSVFD